MSYFDDNFARITHTDWVDADAGSNLLQMKRTAVPAAQPVQCFRCGGGTWTLYKLGMWTPRAHPCMNEGCETFTLPHEMPDDNVG